MSAQAPKPTAQEASAQMAMLQSMFAKNADILTPSTLKEVVKENAGDLDKCVDTILDLLTDPMEAARKEQMERAQREIERARDEQRRRLRDLEANVAAVEAKPASSSSSSSSSSAVHDDVDARVEHLADKAARKANNNSNNNSGKANKQQRESEHKQRLAAEQQLHRDFEERAAEESAALAARMAKLEEERAARLEREITVLRATHNADFQRKVESEVAKRLESVDAKVRARRDAELADSAAVAVENAAAAAAAPAVVDENAAVVELTVSTQHAMPGDSVTVTWRFKRGAPTSRDWLALYKAARPNDSKQYYVTQYTDGEATGQATFVVPAKLGVCEFRFFQRGDYKIVTRSTPLHVGPRVELTARIEGTTVVVRKRQVTGTASSYDWVALFDEAQLDGKQFVGTYSYIATDADATTLLKLPKTPGRYVVRFFGGSSGYSPLAVSNVVVVENHDRVVATPASLAAGAKAALSVTCTIESVDAHKSNWIALFAAEDGDLHNFIGAYKYCPTFGAPVQFDAPDKPGKYVARLFERGSFKVIKESNIIVVE